VDASPFLDLRQFSSDQSLVELTAIELQMQVGLGLAPPVNNNVGQTELTQSAARLIIHRAPLGHPQRTIDNETLAEAFALSLI